MRRTLGIALAGIGFMFAFSFSAKPAGYPARGEKTAVKTIADRDKDGIPDSLDLCPDEPEIVNFYQDMDGCPDDKPNPPRHGPVAGLTFASGLEKPDSVPVLDSLARQLRLYPGMLIEIRGHTDNVEAPDKEGLSLRRAEFVKQHLESLGINPERLRASGAGDKEPLQQNRSGAARMRNRRVDLHIR